MASQTVSPNSGYNLEAPIPKLNGRTCKGGIGTGSSCLVENILSEVESQCIYKNLNNEIRWGEMSHKGGLVPRLVCNEGTIYSNSPDKSKVVSKFIPVYRHPAANPPPLINWTTHVNKIRKIAEEICGHPLNHALIQLYRSGDDYISEHADKTLDIKEGSYICNYSCGSQRTMILRPKKGAREQSNTSDSLDSDDASTNHVSLSKKDKQENDKKLEEGRKKLRIPMLHNSLFLLDPNTNRYMLHSIKRDKRPICEKTDEELIEGGARISITFRWIHTFERLSDGKLFGGGSRRKGILVNEKECEIFVDNKGDMSDGIVDTQNAISVKEDGEQMLIGFSKENTEAESFDWENVYGCGFDAKEAPNFV